jgi:hypothetical protein
MARHRSDLSIPQWAKPMLNRAIEKNPNAALPGNRELRRAYAKDKRKGNDGKRKGPG